MERVFEALRQSKLIPQGDVRMMELQCSIIEGYDRQWLSTPPEALPSVFQSSWHSQTELQSRYEAADPGELLAEESRHEQKVREAEHRRRELCDTLEQSDPYSWERFTAPTNDDDYRNLLDLLRGCCFRRGDILKIAQAPTPAPYPLRDADWPNLSITFRAPSEQDIKITLQLKGQPGKTFTPKEIGLGYIRDGKERLNQCGLVLMNYAKERTKNDKRRLDLGMERTKDDRTQLTKEIAMQQKPANMRSIVGKIRKALQNITGLKTDPFEKKKDGDEGWQPQFRLHYIDSAYTPADDASHPRHRGGEPIDAYNLSKDPRDEIFNRLDPQKQP
jgi:hypothetical protein